MDTFMKIESYYLCSLSPRNTELALPESPITFSVRCVMLHSDEVQSHRCTAIGGLTADAVPSVSHRNSLVSILIVVVLWSIIEKVKLLSKTIFTFSFNNIFSQKAVIAGFLLKSGTLFWFSLV
jgi:hypothetical protein